MRIIVSFLILTLVGCIDFKETCSPELGSPNDATAISNSTVLERICHISFRKKYHSSEEMNDPEIKEFMLLEPIAHDFEHCPLLIDELEEIEFVIDNKLYLENFPEKESDTFLLTNGPEELKGQAHFNENKFSYQIALESTETSYLIQHRPIQRSTIQLFIKEMINGGFPELFILERKYHMNGDNYGLSVYEIK